LKGSSGVDSRLSTRDNRGHSASLKTPDDRLLESWMASILFTACATELFSTLIVVLEREERDIFQILRI